MFLSAMAQRVIHQHNGQHRLGGIGVNARERRVMAPWVEIWVALPAVHSRAGLANTRGRLQRMLTVMSWPLENPAEHSAGIVAYESLWGQLVPVLAAMKTAAKPAPISTPLPH